MRPASSAGKSASNGAPHELELPAGPLGHRLHHLDVVAGQLVAVGVGEGERRVGALGAHAHDGVVRTIGAAAARNGGRAGDRGARREEQEEQDDEPGPTRVDTLHRGRPRHSSLRGRHSATLRLPDHGGHEAVRAREHDGAVAAATGAGEPGLARPDVPALGGRAGPGRSPDAAGRATRRARRRRHLRRPGPVPDGRRRTGTPRPVPWLGTFLETNVRLYSVDSAGRRGVVFLSLDADRLLVVAAARAGLRVPYRWARMSYARAGDVHTYRSRLALPRRPGGPPRPVTSVAVRVGAAPHPHRPGRVRLGALARPHPAARPHRAGAEHARGVAAARRRAARTRGRPARRDRLR